MVAKPGHIGARMCDAVGSQKVLQFLGRQGLFEEAEAVEGGKASFRDLGQDSLDEQSPSPILTPGGELAVYGLYRFAEVFKQGAGAIRTAPQIAAEEFQRLRVAPEMEHHLPPCVLAETSESLKIEETELAAAGGRQLAEIAVPNFDRVRQINGETAREEKMEPGTAELDKVRESFA